MSARGTDSSAPRTTGVPKKTEGPAAGRRKGGVALEAIEPPQPNPQHALPTILTFAAPYAVACESKCRRYDRDECPVLQERIAQTSLDADALRRVVKNEVSRRRFIWDKLDGLPEARIIG